MDGRDLHGQLPACSITFLPGRPAGIAALGMEGGLSLR